MASIANSNSISSGRSAWLWQWLTDELAPYPGRALLVARMVTAATLVVIICETFRIPYAWQAAIYALLVSRENPRATLKSAATILLVTALGAAYLIVSMRFVLNSPPLHFLWVIGTLFVAFYAISTLTSYLAAVAFVNTVSVGIPLWDRHVPAETNVEDTLWLCLATLIAVAVTAGVELTFARWRPVNELLVLITERLSAVENVLTGYAEGHSADPAAEQKIIRLEMVGTSILRRILRRSNQSTRDSTTIGGLAVLVGRLVDLAASLTPIRFEHFANHQSRFQKVAASVARIRHDLSNGQVPGPVDFDGDEQAQDAVPLLGEMEQTVALIPKVFANSRSIHQLPSPPDDLPEPTLLSPDAFVNSDHLRFALKGCLAASCCYVIYNALAWPGISTAVTTCLLTALSTIGSSRQKQILRLAGAIVGGFAIGMGSQVFILPYIDSISGFLILFVVVTALSSWVLTSSPRLSYFGVQVALAFYLVNLQEFRIQTSLSVERDRVVGILVGLFMMWLVFDRLWGTSAVIEMKSSFVSTFRLMAQFAREPLSTDLKIAIGQTLALRETIDANLDKTRALADSVLFEFGPSRQRDLGLRSQIRRWQPQLRALFLMRIASLKYRLQLPGFELPDSVRLRQQAYDEASARMLEELADRVEGREHQVGSGAEEMRELIRRKLQDAEAAAKRELPVAQAHSFATLLGEIDGLTSSLAGQIATETAAWLESRRP